MQLSHADLTFLRDEAIEAAISAGQYIQSQFDKHHDTKFKSTGDTAAAQIVTEVDVAAQGIILERLNATRQTYDLGLLTEEAEDDQSRFVKDYFWCIDPMDGTLAFVEGRTGYSVSIALVSKAGDPIIGVVYVPDLDQCYSAIKGDGIHLNGLSFERPKGSNKDFVWHMDASFKSIDGFQELAVKMEELVAQKGYKSFSIHDTYPAVRNALGVLTTPHSMFFKYPKPTKGGGCIWDYAATRLFFEEKGLFVSNICGEPLHLNSATSPYMNAVGMLFATDSLLVDDVLRLGRKFNHLKD